MIIPYRTRKALKQTGIILLVLALVGTFVWMLWLVWLSRFVIYTRHDGAVLGTVSVENIEGVPALPPEDDSTVSIYYNEGDNAVNTGTELAQMVGYYAGIDDLSAGVDTVRSQIQALEKDVPVMIDVKSISDSFFYSSSVSTYRDERVDPAAMDDLISYLKTSGRYAIARLPGLRDRNYGLNHVDDGVFHSSRQYLYMDDDSCYWLNPASQGTVTYLVQIATELKELGFDEVVFSDFCFPSSDRIYFPDDRTQAIANAAATLVSTCAANNFAVSFVGDASFPLPEGRSRLYVLSASAAEAAGVAQQTGLADPAVHLVFLTENHDTRFDAYSVLRPLSAAH